MEPQIIDHYNELPFGINVIDQMNDELSDLQKENNSLKAKLDKLPDENYMKKFQMPQIKFNSLKEYRAFKKELNNFDWWLSDYHKCDTLIDDVDDINYLILRLDHITQNKNTEWSEYRIKVAVDLYNSFLFDESDDNHYVFKNLIFGLDGGCELSCELPLTYRELSALSKGSREVDDEFHNILEIGYLNCEKCGNKMGYYHPCTYVDSESDSEDDTPICSASCALAVAAFNRLHALRQTDTSI